MILVNPALDDSVLLQRLEPGRQGVRTHSGKRALQVMKLARALKNEVTQDQNGPAVADDIERPGNRTELRVVDGHQSSASEITRLRPRQGRSQSYHKRRR